MDTNQNKGQKLMKQVGRVDIWPSSFSQAKVIRNLVVSFTFFGFSIYSLTLLDLTHEQLLHPGMDKTCIPSIFIKTSQFFLVKAV